MSHISGKEAQLILGITTRQGLHKIVKEHNIAVTSQGAGKPNLYLKSEIQDIAKKTQKQRDKTNPKLKPKIEKQKKVIKKRVEKEKKAVVEVETFKEAKTNVLDKSDFNPLNEIGEDEYMRAKDLLTSNGTYLELDRGMLLSYAISYQNYMLLVKRSSEVDHTTMDDFGNLKVSPYYTMADKALAQMQKLAKDLGIGVRNRIGLDIKAEKKKSMLDVLNENEEF